MTTRLWHFAQTIFCAALMAFVFSGIARAAPYAAIVMDARTGEVLYSTNADTRLHPASLTKMMTLYIAFEAIERGEISLDTMVTVSKHAAAQPPSQLGLKAGQKIAAALSDPRGRREIGQRRSDGHRRGDQRQSNRPLPSG